MQISATEFAPGEQHAKAPAIQADLTSSVIIGAPLSGKTFRLRQIVAALEESGLAPEEILVLTPTRVQAAKLRDLIALDSEQTSSKARAQSVTGFAFSLLSEAGLGLLSGAAQEQLIRQLVDDHRSVWLDWGLDAAVPQLNGFVQELRDLFSVVIENQLSADDLLALSTQFPKLRLKVAIDLLPKYQQLLADQGLVDPAQLAILASQRIPRPPKALVVDDAHNFSLGQLKLVEALLVPGKTFLAGDPDSAVLGFRNSAPAAFIELARKQGFAEQYLAPGEIQPPAVRSLMAKLSARIPASLAISQRQKLQHQEFGDAFLYESQSLESDHLAAKLRKLRLENNYDWDQMAVIGRTRNQLEQLAADLAARGVPARIQGAQLALRDQPMARALLDFSHVALNPQVDPDVEQLLTSPLTGLSSIEFRSLMRQLRQLSGESARKALSKLLAGAAEFDPPKRLAALMERIEKVRQTPEISAHATVSIGFELASARLRELSRGTGPTALAANRALDGALELFAAAQRWDEKGLGPALSFVQSQLSTAIPEDSLAPIGLRPAVQLITPSAAISSYPVVAIPRLQEGIWPNLNPRNSLLGAAALQSYLLGRTADPTLPTRSELVDEIRFFYRAISSASEHLILSCMQDDQEQPSQFFQMMGLPLELNSTPVQFDLRQMVGRLRRRVLAGDRDAASKLAAFAVAGVPGAHPSSWHGLERPVGDPVTTVNSLAASRLEAFERCPLHWFIQNFGGNVSGFSASLGTLMHSALENSAQGADLSSFVSEMWHTLEFESQWQERQAERQAAQMSLLLTDYLSSASELIASEEPFVIEIGGIEIRGKIDRIEKSETGLTVVDLKTGKRVPSGEDVAQNRQLAIYQLAVEQKYGSSSGAKIVSIGSGRLREVSQPPVTDQLRQELEQLVGSIARGLESGSFTASVDEHCASDRSCTLLITPGVSGA